jgi:hypothetical protein
MTCKTLDELLAEEEAALLAKAKAEIAREDAEWAALPPDQKLAIIAEREARYADTPDDDDQDEDDEEDEDDEPA